LAYASPIGAARDSRGVYWIFRVDALPELFDRRGVRGSFGREGRGPGELLAASEVHSLADDSVFVLDGRNLRGTVFDSRKQAVRTVSVPFRVNRSQVLRWPDSVIVSARIATPASIGLPLHLVSFAGSSAWIRASFGAGDGEVRPGDARYDFQEVVRGKDALWSASRFDYRVTSWASLGRPARSFARRPAWFAAPATGGIGWHDRPPSPHVAALRMDEDERLWVFLAVPSRSWRDAWPRMPAGATEVELKSVAVERLYDTMVEVIEPRSGRVLTRSRLPGYVVSALPNGQLARFMVTDEGVQVVEILESAIVGTRAVR